MKICTITITALRIHLLVVSAVIAAPSANAQSGTWTADANGNWSDSANWSGGVIANGADNTATFGNTITADRIVTLDSNRTIGNITASDTTHNYTISGPNLLTLERTDATAPQINVTTAARTLSIASQIAGSAGLMKVGAGTLTLSSANTYSGGTTLSAGRLVFGDAASFGSGAISAITAGTVSIGAATSSLTVPNALDVATGVTLDFVNVATNTTFSGILSGSGAIRSISNNQASPIFSNLGNAFTGAVNLAGNSFSFASLGDGGIVSLGGSNAGTFIWIGGDATFSARQFRTTTSNANGFVLRNNSASTLTIGTNFLAEQTVNTALNLRGTGNGVFAGTIGNSTATGTPTTGITKSDTGTWTLSNTNTYTGPTNVNGGTLVVNGSLAAGSAITVGASDTLGGSGTINGAATISGAHTPGNSPGIQTFASNLTYSGGSSTVQWELVENTTTNPANPNADYDQILVGGNLDFAGTTSLSLVFNGAGSSVLWANSFWDSDQQWTLYEVTGSTTNLGNLSLAAASYLDSASNTLLSARPNASFNVVQSGSDVLISYVAVPEPTSIAVLGAGAALLGLRVARRRKA